MIQQNTDLSGLRKQQVLSIIALFAPVFIAISVVFHDLRLTFISAALVFAFDAYVARKRRLHISVQVALWTVSLASAATVLFVGASLPRG